MKRLAPLGAGLAAFAIAARVLWPGDAAGWGVNLLLDGAALIAAALVLLAEERLRAAPAAWALGALGAWALASCLWAGETLSALSTGSSWLAAGALAWACAQSARATAVHALAASAAGQAAYAIWQRFQGLPALRAAYRADPGMRTFSSAAERLEFEARLWTDEPFGTFPTSNILCAFLAVGLAFLAGRALDARSKRARALAGAAAALVAGAALLTRSTGGYAALLAGAAVFAWRVFAPEGRRRTVAGLAGAAAALLAAAVLLAARPGPFDWKNPHTSLGFRANYSRGSLGVLREAPALGVGASNWGAHYTAHMVPDAGEAQRAHCDPLQVASELGPLGLLLFLAIPAAALFGSLRPEEPPPEPEPGAEIPFPWPAAIGVALAFAFHELLEGSLAHAGLLGAGGVVAAVAAGLVASAEAPVGRFTRAAALAAAAAFAVHGLVEYDLYVPGVTFALAVALGLAATRPLRMKPVLAAAPLALAGVLAMLEAPAWMNADTTLRDDDATLEDVRQAAASNPLDPEIRVREAHTLHAAPHDPAACLRALDEAVRLAPRQAGLRWQRGRLRWDHGERADTAADFRKAVEFYPNACQERFWLGRALRAAGDPGWRAEFARALDLSPRADAPRRRLTPEQEEEARRALAGP
ncbi:MAG: O-antigen ligase family protein [Planctomycetes bacterium]|nr:O-antigen ligase family protein [Planctomycetota bacterium]